MEGKGDVCVISVLSDPEPEPPSASVSVGACCGLDGELSEFSRMSCAEAALNPGSLPSFVNRYKAALTLVAFASISGTEPASLRPSAMAALLLSFNTE